MRFSPLSSVQSAASRAGRGLGVVALVTLAACGGGGAAGGGDGGGGAAGDPSGVWTAQMFSPTYGPYRVDLVLQSNGQFSHQWSYVAGAVVSNTGTWRTLPEQAILRLDALQAVPSSALIGETSIYGMPDGRTLVSDLYGCGTPGTGECRIVYSRVGP